ncbi:MAG TPA: hypothetical protein VFN03_03680 [Trueperaceae bacterium]|nr:hypothetical protein [Trueperaceae bacterium]
MRAPRAFHSFVLAAALLCCSSLTVTLAQVLEVTASVAAGDGGSASPSVVDAGTMFSVAVRQVRVGSTTVGVALAHSSGTGTTPSATDGTGAAQLDVELSANETFGPLGNVIFELAGSLRTDARAQVEFTVRGTIGPVAARARLSAFSDDAVVFSPAELAADARPSLGRAGVGAALGVTARFGRSVILDVEPEFYLTGAGLTTRLDARVRRLRTFGDNELRVYLDGAFLPGAGGGPGGAADWHAAIGAGVLFPRGRAPDVEFAVMLGTRGSALSPGLRVSVAETLAGGVRLSLDGSLEPYRVDVHPARATAVVQLPVAGDVTLRLTAAVAALDMVRPTVFAVRSMISVPIDLR